MSDQRILVVFYSRTGTTRAAAQAIANALGGAELEEIQDTEERHGWRGYVRSAIEAIRGRIVPLASPGRDPRAYELVVVGTPVWFGSVSSPTRSYLAANAGRFRLVGFFLTQGGTSHDRVFRQMEQVSAVHPAALVAIREQDIGGSVYLPHIEEFARELRKQLPAAIELKA